MSEDLPVLSSFLFVAGEMGFARLTGGGLDLTGWTAVALVDRRVGAGDFFIFEIRN